MGGIGSSYCSCPTQPRKTLANYPSLPPGPSPRNVARGLTKAAEGCLVGTEAHPADDGLARWVSALKRGTQVQASPSVQCLKISPELRKVTSGNNIVPLNGSPR